MIERSQPMKLSLLASLLLLTCSTPLRAADGYEVIGHLTYTTFGTSGEHRGKRVIMFDVKIGRTWCVHTEPVIECKGGIGFLEGFSDTNNCIWFLTGFEAAYKPSVGWARSFCPMAPSPALRREMCLSPWHRRRAMR